MKAKKAKDMVVKDMVVKDMAVKNMVVKDMVVKNKVVKDMVVKDRVVDLLLLWILYRVGWLVLYVLGSSSIKLDV